MGGLSVPKTFASSLQIDGEVLNIPGNANSVAVNATAQVVSYTVPAGKVFFLQLVEFNGSNIADYEVFKDTDSQAKKTIYWGGDFHGSFFFGNLKFLAGEIIKLEVTNISIDSNLGDFDGRILGVLSDA